MAIRTHTLATTGHRPIAEVRGDALAALPAGSIAAVFDSWAEAADVAARLAVEHPTAGGWLATGAQAAARIRAARASRPLLSRVAGHLSDDEAVVNELVAAAAGGATVLVVGRPESTKLPPLPGARHVTEFGQWTIRVIR